MKLIVGLGNPGRVYINSRHNIGFAVIKALAKTSKIKFKKDKNTLSLKGRGKIAGFDVILAMPLTFMNLSGISVKALLEKYNLDLGELLIVCDDLDLNFSRLKIRASGSSAGHKGLESVIENLGSLKFARLRIGIGRPQKSMGAAEYVLASFGKNEKKHLPRIINDACACCLSWVSEGISQSMNIFNKW
ncbi:MAG: aminoacyl-tRNA hydrolase [Candidatus Omnitrophota bacterium]|nr:MAG: aminoacyl-tRNA hydrolase [Candidatus Omnitrophota bacterium]